MPKEIRASAQPLQSENGGKTVAGYAAVFNSPTDIGGMWTEVVQPGAFTDTLANDQDVLALYSHELERLLGRESAGTLRLKQDDKGLAVEIDLPDTSDGRDVGVLIQRGDLKGMSFGFSVTKQEWDETVTPPKRTIMAVELYEVTITADPAYPDTEIGMAELAEARSKRAEHNRSAWLRRKGIIVRERETEHKIRRLPGA
jgi:HK97 family phage prohead protease